MNRKNTNLLTETLDALGAYDKSIDDVVWIGCPSFQISKDDFITLANKMYDSGYGWPEVAHDLIVAGYGWWLERAEYDGSEWWEYKTQPTIPQRTLKVKTLFTNDLLSKGLPKNKENV